MSMICRHYKLPFGAEPEADGVRFRLWAPSASRVSVQFESGQPRTVPMRRQRGGWFSLATPLAAPGARYLYIVDGKAVPDPASRYQPLGVHGPSEVVDPGEHAWGDHGWRGRRWEEIVIYELHVGAFSETGDFAGAIEHLDHIERLGATAVELMPIAEFPGGRNWGYDGVFLYAPASRYGGPGELKRLVDACHTRGLAIFLDVVYNHFGPEGNYLPSIAPEFFTDRQHTPWGAGIDFSAPHSRPVRDFFVHNALYWLDEFHFDGLRLDAVHAINDESSPDIIDEIAQSVRQGITGREVHLVLENDRNQARRLTRAQDRVERYTAQWNDDLHHVLHFLLTGEDQGYYGDYAERPGEHLGRALAQGFAYQGECSPFRGGKPRGEPSAKLPATAFVAFLQNHDQVGNRPFGTRLTAHASEAALHSAIAIVLLSPQIPLLFMGEEWASLQPFAFFCDFKPDLADAVRSGRRREFAHFPEFRDVASLERIPDPTAPSTFAMSRLDWTEPDRDEHARWLNRYRRLLTIRGEEIVPRLGGIPSFAGSYRVLGPRAASVEWRLGDRSRLMLLANFSDQRVPFVPMTDGRMLYSSSEPGAPLSAAFFLGPEVSVAPTDEVT
jgi:maltooligosyltrehalose trehalohydrolase